MTELERIKELTPKFQLTVLGNINTIEQFINEIIDVDFTKDPKDIYKRVEFFKYFEQLNLHSKIDLLKIILKVNHPDIFKKYPNFFVELGDVKKWRDSIAHNTITYERDSTEKNARLILNHPVIKKQKKLSERQMQGIMKKVEKCTEDTRNIWISVGMSKGLKFG